MIKNLNIDKNKIKFTLFYLLFLVFSLFTHLIQHNKINWSKPDSLTFQEKINYNVYSTNENGFFYNLANNQEVLQTWKLYLNVIWQDEDRDNNTTFDTFDYNSYYFNNFDIFSNDYNSFSYDKIIYYFQDYLNDYILNNNLVAFRSYEQIDINFYCDEINFDYQLNNTISVNSDTFITANHYDTQDAPILHLGVVNFNNNTKNVSSQLFTFDNSNLEFNLQSGYIYSFGFRIMSYINSDYANYYFNYSSVINSLYDQINLLNNQINNYLAQINDITNAFNNLNSDFIHLQSVLEDLNSYVADLQFELSSSNTNNEYLTTQLNQAQAQITLLTRQLNNAQNAEFNFNKLMFTIASTPLESFKTFYNVSFWGINLSDLFLGIVFSGLIFFLFRRFIGSFFSI